jgi:phytoene dehydrogenase-like protein
MEETMSKPSVIIIGAGLGVLSSGTYGQMNGYQCRIFEHARHPGGVAAEWKRQGYTIDGGIHFYMGYRPGRPDHDIYRELGLCQEDQYLEMTTYGRFRDPSDTIQGGICNRSTRPLGNSMIPGWPMSLSTSFCLK